MRSYPHLAARLFDTELMIEPGKLAAIVDSEIGRRILAASIDVEGAEPVDHVAFAGGRPSMGRLGDPLGRRRQAEARPSLEVLDGVGVIAIEGSLVHKGKWTGSYSGDTSYEGLLTQVAEAKRRPNVRGVVFEVDSFGGEVSGAFDTAAAIADLSKVKPTIAILTDHALSAGYLLAAAARSIVIPETGRAGSIGVVTLHRDVSRAIDKAGMTVTVLSAGKFKADGNPYSPLDEATAGRISARLEKSRLHFATAVAGFRGSRLTVEAALATEADHFDGEEAVAKGLADAVGRPSEAFELFLRQLNPASRPL